MTKIQQFLADLPEEKKSCLSLFSEHGEIYTVVYLIAGMSTSLIRRSQIVMRIVYR